MPSLESKTKDLVWFLSGGILFFVICIFTGAVFFLKKADEKVVNQQVVVSSLTPEVARQVIIVPKQVLNVEILNGTGISGFAKKESEKLKARDATLKVTLGNSDKNVSRTMISYKEEGHKNSTFAKLAKELWPNFEENIDLNLTVDARVILGK